MFAVGILFDENLVPDSVVIWDSRGILSYEILQDKFLFAALDVGPVGFKADVVDVITAENKLCGRCLRGSVNGRAHAESDGGEDATPRIFDRKIILIFDLFCTDHVM